VIIILQKLGKKGGINMQHNLASDKARLNIQIPSELKERLSRLSAVRRKKVSVLVRESIEEKLKQFENEMFEEKMKQAYLDLARENIEISEDFRHSDAENI
jgi:predicted DNA-binding protein